MRTLNKSRLEIYVEAWLRQHNRANFRIKQLDFLRKALVYVQQFLESTCCDDSEAVIDLHTRLDNDLTRTVFEYLKQMTRRGNIKSLQRVIVLLEKAIDGACCTIEIPFDASSICVDSTDFYIEFIGQNGEGTYRFTPEILTVGNINLLKWLDGQFIAHVHGITSDYINTTLFDADDSPIVATFTTSGDPNAESLPFDIDSLDHILFTCTPSG